MVLRYRRPLQIYAARSILLPTNNKYSRRPKKILKKKFKKKYIYFEIGNKTLFSIGNGADKRQENTPRKIPGIFCLLFSLSKNIIFMIFDRLKTRLQKFYLKKGGIFQNLK